MIDTDPDVPDAFSGECEKELGEYNDVGLSAFELDESSRHMTEAIYKLSKTLTLQERHRVGCPLSADNATAFARRRPWLPLVSEGLA